MTSQLGSETIAIHILLNISRSKGNEKMKFGQSIECDKRTIFFFFKNHAENEAGRLVPELFIFLKKALYEVKTSAVQLSFNYFDSPQLGI